MFVRYFHSGFLKVSRTTLEILRCGFYIHVQTSVIFEPFVEKTELTRTTVTFCPLPSSGFSFSEGFGQAHVESIRSGNSHVTSNPFPTHPMLEWMLRHSFVTPSRREGPPSIWDTHGISGNVFANPDASLSAPYPQELNQWNSSMEEPLQMSRVEKSERPEQNRDLRCQSGPSAKDSVIFSGVSDLHFHKFPTTATFALEDEIHDRVMWLFTISHGKYAMDHGRDG